MSTRSADVDARAFDQDLDLHLFVSALRGPGVNNMARKRMRESANKFFSRDAGRESFQDLFDAASLHLAKAPHLLEKLNLILKTSNCKVIIVHEPGSDFSVLFVVRKVNQVFIIAPSSSHPILPAYDTASIRSALRTQSARVESNELPTDITDPPSSLWAGALMEILLFEFEHFPALYEQGHVDASYGRNCIHLLCRLSLKFSRLPPSYYRLESDVKKSAHVNGGAFADIHQGSLHGTEVCIKVLRLYTNQTENGRRDLVKGAFTSQHPLTLHLTSTQIFCREALCWGILRHRNILPFLGVCEDFPSLWLISPWMDYGSLLKFLEKYPNFPRRQVVIDMAEGLRYLHEHDPPIVHADIRGANILVTADHRFCLADFGLLAITEMTVTSVRQGGTGAWMAPEIIDEIPEGTPPSPKRDIFAFGSTLFEIFTGNNPFRARPFAGFTEIWCMHRVVEGDRAQPPASDSFPDEIRTILDLCWQADPTKRPSAREILRSLGVPSSPTYTLLRRPDPSFTVDELHAKLRADYNYLSRLTSYGEVIPSQEFFGTIMAELEPIRAHLKLIKSQPLMSPRPLSFDLSTALNSSIRKPVPRILKDLDPGLSFDAKCKKYRSDHAYLNLLISTSKEVPRQAFLNAIAQELQAVCTRLTNLEVEHVGIKLAKLDVGLKEVVPHSVTEHLYRGQWQTSSWQPSPGDIPDHAHGKVPESIKYSYFFNK